MLKEDYETLSQAMNDLNKNGFGKGFVAEDTQIRVTNSALTYEPNELEIVHTYRFEGMSNPQDDTILFAIEAEDGVKGTLVMSYSSKHSQNVELIKQIPKAVNH